MAGAAAVLSPPDALAQVVSRATFRAIAFSNMDTGEQIRGTYWRAGRYDPAAFARINYFLRDWRAGRIAPIDPWLIDILWVLQMRARGRELVVTSGFRTPETNAYLSRIRPGVAKDSFHLRGRAVDLTVPGFDLRELRTQALELRAGGVGYYPAANFLHIDTGPVRAW